MASRDDILAQLGAHSSDALAEVLAALRVRDASSNPDDNNGDTSVTGTGSIQDDNAAGTPAGTAAPATDTTADLGVFARAYASNELLDAHATLYSDFEAVDPVDVHGYLRNLNDIEPTQRPCYVICSGGPAPRLLVLHGIALYQRDLRAPSPFDGNTFAFFTDAGPDERASSLTITTAWFDKEAVRTPTFEAFTRAIRAAPDDATITATCDTNKSVSPACLLPTRLAPILLNNSLSPTAAWPLLRTAASDHNLLGACKPLWDWLCTVGVTAHATTRLDVLLPVAGTPAFRKARMTIQQAITGLPSTSPAAPTCLPRQPTDDAAAIAIGELTQGIRSLSATPKTALTVETRWPYQVDEILRMCDQHTISTLPPIWHALAKEKRGTPARICLQVACDAAAKLRGLEAPVITHHIANMTCDVAFVALDRSDLLSGYSPFLFPTLTPSVAQALVNDLRVWDTHLVDGNKSTVADARQATQLARLAPLRSFVDVYAMLCRNEVLLAVILGDKHHVVADLQALRLFVFRDFMAVERRMSADKTFGTLLLCAVRGNLAGFFRSAANPSGRPLYTQLATMVDDLELGIWRPPQLPTAFTSFFARAPPPPPLRPQPQPLRPPSTPNPGAQPRRQRDLNTPLSRRLDNPSPVRQWQVGQRRIRNCIDAAREAGVAIPVMDDGTDACLTWHFKGQCSTDCRGAAVHKRPSATEFRRLDNFNRRFCHGNPIPSSPAPPATPSHPAFGTYEQPSLPRDPAPPRRRPGRPRTPRRPSTPPTPATQAPPPLPVVHTNNPDAASTLGPAQHDPP